MNTSKRTLPVLCLVMTALLFAAPVALAQEEFEEAELFFELNNTDGDLGIQALIDGGPWRRLEIWDMDDKNLLDIRVRGRLRRQALTEIFFESAEPTFDELLPKTFFKRFPEGEYTITGLTPDDEPLESTAELTHVMPAPPGNVEVSKTPAIEGCDNDPLPAFAKPIVISWAPVTQSHPDLGITSVPIVVDSYQLVVEREEPTELLYSVDLDPGVTKVRIPNGMIDSGEELKFEIVVQEESGNRTAYESCFEVE